ncbi:MAG: hypothetical protein BAJATHORv1_130007 [Candidatus Thorarchaeota archaeon]|nr:MAG: hypothetical protein BAJATHORv1_130007 [Candidatus Thorarchaeota archaeon]
MVELFKCRLVPEDFLFFVSREFNTYTVMQPAIHNYALTYALADWFHTVALSVEPSYAEITEFDNYATPALPLERPHFMSFTYNAVDTKTNLTQSSYNVPALGYSSKIPPLSTEFEFFIFSRKGIIPKFIRVGKKSCICRLRPEKLDIDTTVSQPTESVNTDVCFNVLDLSANDMVENADMLLMYPSPIAKSMIFQAPHLIARLDDKEYTIPIPRHLRELFNND